MTDEDKQDKDTQGQTRTGAVNSSHQITDHRPLSQRLSVTPRPPESTVPRVAPPDDRPFLIVNKRQASQLLLQAPRFSYSIYSWHRSTAPALQLQLLLYSRRSRAPDPQFLLFSSCSTFPALRLSLYGSCSTAPALQPLLPQEPLQAHLLCRLLIQGSCSSAHTMLIIPDPVVPILAINYLD